MLSKFSDVPTVTYIVVFVLGMIGAVINFFRRELAGCSFVKKVFLFLFDALVSGLFAIIGFYATMGMGLNELLAIAASGIFAHQGTRAVYIIELVITEKLGAKMTFEEIKKSRK